MRPSVQGVTPGELLRLAASVDQVSAHVLGDALAEAAAGAGLRLTLPSQAGRRSLSIARQSVIAGMGLAPGAPPRRPSPFAASTAST
jgi:cation transport ATPase